jgi:hypothetical protein
MEKRRHAVNQLNTLQVTTSQSTGLALRADAELWRKRPTAREAKAVA